MGALMLIEIVRDATLSGPAGTFGHMFLDGQPFCVTCEQPWQDNLQGHSCIPLGEYQLIPYNSPAHGATVVFHNPALDIYGTPSMIPDGVHGRSLCEIHNANWPFQLQGCVAVGAEIVMIPPNGRGVTSSVSTLQQLFAKWGDRSGLTAVIRSSDAD